MHHQAPLLVGLNVMNAFIARHPVEKTNVLFSKCSLPGDDVANFHSLAQAKVIYRCKIILAIVKIDHQARQDIVGEQVSYSLSLWERARVRARSVEKKEKGVG